MVRVGTKLTRARGYGCHGKTCPLSFRLRRDGDRGKGMGEAIPKGIQIIAFILVVWLVIMFVIGRKDGDSE